MINKLNFQSIKGLQVVMIYGSVARNDEDSSSDLDVFALVNDILTEREQEEVVENIASKLKGDEINISLYTESIFKKMLKEGSLFLWHLKLEGIYIYNKYDLDIFFSLSNFNGYDKNLELYQKLFKRCKQSLVENNVNSYDLSMLFFICRNLSILTCFYLNEPSFGRYSSYQTLINKIRQEPLKYTDYVYLSKWRMDYTRGIEEELEYPDNTSLAKLVLSIESLFTLCETIIGKGNEYGID